MDPKAIASDLLRYVKPENVVGLVHCATRLRFRLKDEDLLDDDVIGSIPGVLGVVRSAGQYQIIIGPDVIEVYKILSSTLNIGEGTIAEENAVDAAEVKLIDKIFNYISGSFQSLLPAMAGAGMLLGVAEMFVSFHWISNTSATYAVLSAIGNTAFHFMPILLGFSAAKHLGATPMLGAMLGGSLMHPMIQGLVTGGKTSFLGIPFVPMDYASTVIPILVGVALMAPLERYLKRIIPKSLLIILLSLVVLSIMVPAVLLIFGPITTYLQQLLGKGIEIMFTYAPPLAGAILGGTWFLLVTMGLHWGVIPLFYMQYGMYGYVTLYAPLIAATMAQIGVVSGVLILNKNKDFRTLFTPPVGLAMLAGITEPIIYGVILKYRRLIPIVVGVGAIGGAFIAMLQIKTVPAGMGGLVSWPGFLIDLNTTTQKIVLIGAHFVIIALGIMAVLLLGYQDKRSQETKVS